MKFRGLAVKKGVFLNRGHSSDQMQDRVNVLFKHSIQVYQSVEDSENFV